MAKNRELSQLGSFVVVNDTNGNIGIATTATPSVGIGTTNPTSKLTVNGDALVSGVVTATQLSTGASGTGINITSNTITGPSTITIDPAAIGDDTGAVRIKGDFYVDGTQFVVNSTTIELGDFNVGIATTVGTNALLDGAGIGIGSVSIRKTFTYDYTNDSLKSSENLNIPSGKTYKINGVDVVSSTTLGSGVVNSSLTSVGTLNQLSVTGPSTLAGITTVTGETLFAKQLNVSGVSTLGSVVQITQSGIVTSTNPGVTTVVYYGDGSNLFGVSAFAVINQDLAPDVVYPTLANNSGVSTVGIATTGTGSFVFKPTTGNVGLGSTQPAYKIDAVGDINITGSYRIDGRSVLDDALVYAIVFG